MNGLQGNQKSMSVPNAIAPIGIETESREIPLTRGMVALVDIQDYEWLMQWKWQAVNGRNTFYASRRKDVSMAREILSLKNGDKRKPDHLNGNGLDNRRCNLRISDNFLNGYNCKMQKHNTSGYRGVSKYRGGRWISYIKVGGMQIHCGYYGTPEEAAIAHDIASIKQYGENAMLNFPQEVK